MTQPITPATEQTHDIGDPREPESAQTTEKQPKYKQKTIEAIRLVQTGADPETALRITNGKNKISERAIFNLKEKCRKYTLTNPRLVKLAHNAVKDCLTDQPIISKRTDKQGLEIIEETAPTWANKIAAASMVYDRVEPTRQTPEVVNQSLTINAIPPAAQEIIDRLIEASSRKMVKVEGNIIDAE